MTKYSKFFFLLILSIMFMVGCSDNNEDATQEINTEKNDTAENTEQAEENENNDENSSDAIKNTADNATKNEHVEHQEGLKMGETGIVEDAEEKYEVTLNSIEYSDDVGDFKPENDTYAVVNLTVKNIDDHKFNAKSIYSPSFGPKDVEGLEASLNPVLMEGTEDVDKNLLEGEIETGESVSGVHVYDVQKTENKYLFIIGGSGQQIQTYAQWEVSDSEIED